jgi:hypothetical protein
LSVIVVRLDQKKESRRKTEAPVADDPLQRTNRNYSTSFPRFRY